MLLIRPLLSAALLLGATSTALMAAEEAPAPSAPVANAAQPSRTEIIVSVAEQKLALVRDGEVLRKYPISTSRFGIGDSYGSYRTPLGHLKVDQKIGDGLPAGAVIKHRSFTGEVLKPNAPGRDPIVSRILWLNGQEATNANAHARGVYIHGTPDEKHLGRPASYGCIRMRSSDVIELYAGVPVGTDVSIIPGKLPGAATHPLLALFASVTSGEPHTRL
jgi:lipoprotein-anchoring transpeptidase ErfK/SrfK